MINYQKQAFAIVVAFFFCSCQEKMTEDEISKIGIESCRKPAAFISKIGLNSSRAAFSSSDKRLNGIVLIEAPINGQDSIIKKWQDSTWTRYGHMGSITTDENGNVYTAPIPFVNNLENTLKTIHSIYKIDSKTGTMSLFTALPDIDSVAGVCAFGVLGLYYDCHGKKLYAASVGGSTQDVEKGVLYVIDPMNGHILDRLADFDALGLFVGGMTGQKILYFGHARSSEIYGIELDKEGKFVGKARVALSLDGLGPRGLDKARRIRADKSGNLQIYGIDFSFNLAAQTDRPESLYRFAFNKAIKKWELIDIKN
jgi:hypothetical protein